MPAQDNMFCVLVFRGHGWLRQIFAHDDFHGQG